MKQKLQKYLSGEREGFSLIELIIVIAIMAILIGVVALAVIPYLERSREGKDRQTVDTVYSAFSSTIALHQIEKPSSDIKLVITDSGFDNSSGAAFDANFQSAMAEAMGTTSTAADIKAAVIDKLGSEIAKATKATDSDLSATAGQSGYAVVCVLKSSGEIKVGAGEVVSSNRGN